MLSSLMPIEETGDKWLELIVFISMFPYVYKLKNKFQLEEEGIGIMGVCRGEKHAFAPPLEIGTKNQIFLENLKLAAKFRLIHVAMTVDLPVSH